MPVHAAGPLQHQVYRCQVADHEVEIQVQALLDHLGRDQDGPVGPIAVLAETRYGTSLPAVSLLEGELRVKQIHLHPVGHQRSAKH